MALIRFDPFRDPFWSGCCPWPRQPHRRLRRRCPASDHPVSPKTQACRVEITRAPGGSRTLSGSTSEQGEGPAGGTGGAG
jgi:hypothetical protein